MHVVPPVAQAREVLKVPYSSLNFRHIWEKNTNKVSLVFEFPSRNGAELYDKIIAAPESTLIKRAKARWLEHCAKELGLKAKNRNGLVE